jgi:antitoxin component HigA of HigAB toxin-antitoxin module/mRNA-degrading endonuclease HigB of HigAB toxin-antitoxin module
LRIISRRPLREFGETHADARGPLDAWHSIVKGREYRSPHELRQDFPTASFLGGSRTVFNIGGDKHRLVVDMRYDLGRVYVREVLAHEEYDRRSIDGTLREREEEWIVSTDRLDFSRPHVLRSETEHDAAIAEIERLLDEDVEAGSEGYDRLEFLSVLVEHYEDERYPMGAVTPREAVSFMLEQKGLERSDLDGVMGGRSRVSEFLTGKRELSKSQVEGLRRLLGIPADVLLGLEG